MKILIAYARKSACIFSKRYKRINVTKNVTINVTKGKCKKEKQDKKARKGLKKISPFCYGSV
jgi:hypothetical protein